jgi:hypothetical protein
MRFLTFFMILHAVVAARMLDPDENDTLTDRCYDGKETMVLIETQCERRTPYPLY